MFVQLLLLFVLVVVIYFGLRILRSVYFCAVGSDWLVDLRWIPAHIAFVAFTFALVRWLVGYLTGLVDSHALCIFAFCVARSSPRCLRFRFGSVVLAFASSHAHFAHALFCVYALYGLHLLFTHITRITPVTLFPGSLLRARVPRSPRCPGHTPLLIVIYVQLHYLILADPVPLYRIAFTGSLRWLFPFARTLRALLRAAFGSHIVG